MELTLHRPLIITPRLLPGVEVGFAQWISWDPGKGVGYIDTPNFKHTVTSYTPGLGGRSGPPEERVAYCLADMCGFLSACAESRSYAKRKGIDPMEGENSDLFPEEVGEWAEKMSDELSMLSFELSEYQQDEE